MQLEFTKMHGLGNDFVVINAINQVIDLSTEQVRFIADRRLGVGCDQLLLVEATDSDDVDFRYRIFNSDGGEVEQCGNGARCFASFVLQEGLTTKQEIPVSTNTGRIILNVLDADEAGNPQVRVDMGEACLQPDMIPFISEQQNTSYTLNTPSDELEIGVVSMGNPHAVLVVNNIDTAPVNDLGSEIESHPRFPNRVNVGFMQVVNRNHIRLRVYERGVGETRACGTGACAAVVSGQLRGLLADDVKVSLLGGELDIEWLGVGTPVFMTGSTATVFKGKIAL